MTKNAVEKIEQKLPEVMDDDLTSLMQEDVGKGTSQAAEDNLVPLIYILQSNSPQVNKRGDAYIEGAESGDIWLRHAPQPIIKGNTGFIFVPCYWFKDYVEWIPRDAGGGFVGRHKDLPPECMVQEDPKNPNKVRNVMPNGNELVLTANHAGFVLMEDGRILPYLIPMKSTGLTVSRQWMYMMNSKSTRDGKVLPSFSHKYRLTTKHRKNKDGEWDVFDVSDVAMLTNNEKYLYLMGRSLEQAFKSGQKQGEAEIAAGGERTNDKDLPF